MNQRERILAIAVGSLFVLGIGQWGYTKYKTALESRQSKHESLEDRKMQLTEQTLQGALADRQMGEYMIRSVSSDVEQARSDYQGWLFDVVEEHDIKEAKVDSTRTVPGELFSKLTFVLTGRAEAPELLGLLHEIQAKDYLHRMREFDIKPAKTEEGFTVTLTMEVAALNNAPVEAKSPESDSWRINGDVASYGEAILNRNLFEPPNNAPSYSGDRTLQATKGREEAFPLAFRDREEHGLRYGLIDPPSYVTIDERSGTLRVRSDEITEFEVNVRVTDDGFPKRVVEEKLLVKVVDPPPPPPPEKPALEFDDAKQTYLTGLVQGANDWTAWMNVRTKGKTLRLRVGDEFEIGSVRGVIESIDADVVKIKIDDKVVSLASGGTLKSAVDAAE